LNNEEIINVLVERLKTEGATKIEIFGSFLKEDIRSPNDIDIIVEFEDKKSLLDLVRIEQDISDELKIHIDLLTPSSISPYILKSIEHEKRVIFSEG